MMQSPYNLLSSQQLLETFAQNAPYPRHIKRLSNGSFICKFGSGTKFFILAGVHGDERSGPVSLVEFFSEKDNFVGVPIEFIVCPLLNTLGWDGNTRNYENKDLNRCFNAKGPKFIKELMSFLKEEKPSYFLDLHEDEDKTIKDYIWANEGGNSKLSSFIAKKNKMNLEYWKDSQKNWKSSSSEEFIRSLGCKNAITSEVYYIKNMENGIRKSVGVIKTMIEYLLSN